jgi:molybdopterin synthase sulfur carrier subunit
MYKVKVTIPQPFRKITEGDSEVYIDCENVKQAINILESNYPGIKEKIIDGDKKLKKYVNIYINDENVRFLNELDSKIKDGDEILILPAIAGG